MSAADVFVQGATFGFAIGTGAGTWFALRDVFGDSMPRLRDLYRELAAVRALLATQRSTERAQQQLLEEARRQLHRQEES